MHLILTSCEYIVAHFKKLIKQCKVLFFPNEKATQEMIQSEKYYNWMQIRGFEKENTYKVFHSSES